MMTGGKRKGDFELNLVPFIDILSTCICFLLMTTMWVNLKGLNMKQAVGSETDPKTAEAPLIEAEFSDKGDVFFRLKNVPKVSKTLFNFSVGQIAGKPDWPKVREYILAAKSEAPTLKAAIILPKAGSKYENLMELMGLFKEQELVQVGIAPI